MANRFYGWDVGGAHLKWACLNEGGEVLDCGQMATPIWQGLDSLEWALRSFQFPDQACHAATFTGELADSFGCRIQGLQALVDLLCACLCPARSLRLYSSSGSLLTVEESSVQAESLMSANWHAMARWVSKREPCAILVDIGSTSSDLIPILNGEPASKGMDDQARLASGELLYTGVVRTPVMTVARQAPWRGAWQGLMNECFATMADVYRIRGELDERDDLHPAADGGAKDVPGSLMRLARMLGTDWRMDCERDLKGLANYLADCQRRQLERAWSQLVSAHVGCWPIDAGAVVATGSGAFLAERLALMQGWHPMRLSQMPSISSKGVDPKRTGALDSVATAFAVADLLREAMA